ncbi:17068_t:CDS:2 [Gigaspora rosea]|nr:17068_t:CDS:2 [Gigaspora rosea]
MKEKTHDQFRKYKRQKFVDVRYVYCANNEPRIIVVNNEVTVAEYNKGTLLERIISNIMASFQKTFAIVDELLIIFLVYILFFYNNLGDRGKVLDLRKSYGKKPFLK